jgi:hypothetical protein
VLLSWSGARLFRQRPALKRIRLATPAW